MIRQAVPWATSAFTLLAMHLLARKDWRGWVVGLANQVLWVATAILFRTWGLLPLTAALIVVYTRGLSRWRRDICASCGEPFTTADERHPDNPKVHRMVCA